MQIRCDSCNHHLNTACEPYVRFGDNYYHKACHQKFRLKLAGAVATLAVLAFLAFKAHADQIFPIGKPFPEQAVYCKEIKSAEALAREQNQPQFIGAMIRSGECFIGAGMATYTKLVSGGKFSVWELQLGGLTLYTSTDWKGKGEL